MKCNRCGTEETEKFYKDEKHKNSWMCKECIIKNAKERYKYLKRKAVLYKGGKCERCGYDNNIYALDFHHTSNNKDAKISVILYRTSWEKAKIEIDKCMLVCSRCHREIHNEDGKNWKNDDFIFVDFSNLGKEYKNRIIYICAFCKKEFSRKSNGEDKIPKYCSHECCQNALRRVVRPSSDELKSLLEQHSQSCVAKLIGVSDVTILKWARSYGLK